MYLLILQICGSVLFDEGSKLCYKEQACHIQAQKGEIKIQSNRPIAGGGPLFICVLKIQVGTGYQFRGMFRDRGFDQYYLEVSIGYLFDYFLNPGRLQQFELIYSKFYLKIPLFLRYSGFFQPSASSVYLIIYFIILHVLRERV